MRKFLGAFFNSVFVLVVLLMMLAGMYYGVALCVEHSVIAVVLILIVFCALMVMFLQEYTPTETEKRILYGGDEELK